MLDSLELLVEKVEGGNFRVIIFEVYPEEPEVPFNILPYYDPAIAVSTSSQSPRSKYYTPGKMKSVTDIMESPQPWLLASGLDSFWTSHGVTISEVHSDVNFGRAKTLATKIKKICESLG